MARRNRKEDLKDQALSYLKRAVSDNSDLLDNAERNMRSYMMEPYGNEVTGRSQFVTSDVADTVEWIMPTLMRLFYGAQYVFDVMPTGPEDEEKAKAMNAKVNFDFMQAQNGYMILHDWFKSALMNKISATKYWWEEEIDRRPIEFEGLTEDEVAAIREDPEYDMDDATITVENGLYNVETYRVRVKSYPKCEVLPPEEFIFAIKSRTDVRDADFVAHKKRVHKNYLKSQYKVKDSDLEAAHQEFHNGSMVEDARFDDLGGISFLTDDEENKNFYFIYECYLNDYDKEGNKVPVKVVVLGNEVIDLEENAYRRPPFCTLSSIRVPHRMAGLSISDLMYDLQRLHTSLQRAIMDNVYYQNNGVNVVNPFRVNMDDVINRKEPGATWRTLHDIDPSSAIFPVQPNPIAPQTMSMLDVVSKMKERRSGVNDYGQEGLSQQTLNKTAAGMSQVMTQALERIEMIARLFAETGVRDLAEQLIQLNIDYLDQETAVKINDAWTQISPEDIDGKFDVIVDVGVGTASKEMKINQLIMMFQTLPVGMQSGAVTGENVYELYYAIYELMGYKIPDRFTSKPQMDPQMQQMHEQMQQQIQQLTEMVKFLQTEHDIKMEETKIKWAELALAEREMEVKYQMESEDIGTQSVLKMREIESREDIAVLNARVKGAQSAKKATA
jgi:hypothetical protein